MPTWTTIGTSTLTPVDMTRRKEILVPLRRTDYTLLYHYGDLDKTPMRGVSYLATFVNGETRSGTLNDKGQAQMCAVPAGAVTVSYQHEAANTDDANIILARDKVRKALDAIVAQTQTDMAREWQRWNEAGWLKRQYLETLKTYEGRTLGAWHWLSGTLEGVWQLAILCCKLDKEELELAYLFSTGQWRALDEKIAGYRKEGRRMLAEASEAKALLNLVFHDQQTRTLITEFAKKWWEAIPPHERDEMVMDSGTQIIIDVVIGVLLAAFSAGAAGEAYGSAKWTAAGGRLGARVRELLDALKEAFEELAKALKLRKRGMTKVTREANAERVIESKWKPGQVAAEVAAPNSAVLPEGIYANPQGVYGYLPKAGSRYASDMYDFSNPEFVSRNRQIRIGYLKGSDDLESAIATMRENEASSEQIANRVVWQRNSQKMEARALMTNEEVQILESGSLKRYGDAVGPTPQQLFDKYGDWETVIQKSMEKDPAINMLLGIPIHR